MQNITWLGHDTFKIIDESGVVIYTDPFKLTKSDRADVILITHDHFDHLSIEDVQKIQTPETVIVTTEDCAAKLSGNIVKVKPSDKVVVKGIEIEAVPAYNTNKDFHPKSKGWVGFIFKVSGKRYYLAGDTDYIPEMKTFKDIDVALIPVSGTYVMTADEAVQAVLDIKPKLAVPMHYASIVGSEDDAKRFVAELSGKVPTTILTQSK